MKLAVGAALLYIFTILVLFATGLLGLVALVALAVLTLPLALITAVALLPLLSQLPLALISFLLGMVLLYVATPAFKGALGVDLMPLAEGGEIVWWRVVLFLLVSLSIYALLDRVLSRP